MEILYTTNQNGDLDWAIDPNGGGFQIASGLDSLQVCVLTSLFTDNLATPEFVVNDGTNNRRGWWANPFCRFSYGSNLWQLYRAGITSQTLLQAQNYVNDCLAWLTLLNVAASYTVNCYWAPGNNQALAISIAITQTSGTVIPMLFSWAWGTTSVTIVTPTFGNDLLDENFVLDVSTIV